MFWGEKIRKGIGFRPLSVFLVILVTRSCHSSTNNNGDVVAGFGDTAAAGTNILSPNLNFLDYDLCLANYDVSEGSIIRTKDSQALGGRFINESDLGPKSREECLRLCCRTPHCNVISFEEKNSGSCYLFDCGPLENFRCKFTEQSHYMSAILRKRQDPPPSPAHNQHEAELSQLRNGDDNRGVVAANSPLGRGFANISQPIAPMPPAAAALVIPPATATAALDGRIDNNSRPRCSRRQFECKSTRECIAIYNACDGIVQCPDGSDESLDLNCPSVLQDSSLLNKVAKDGMQQQQQQLQSQGTSGVDTSLVPGGGTKSLSSSSSRVEDFRLAPPPAQSQSNLNRQQGSGIGNKDRTFETSSRINIFNHKDGGIMDDTYGNQLQQQRQNPPPYWKSYDYGTGEAPNGYGQTIPQLQNPGAYGGIGINSNGQPYPYPQNFQSGYPQQIGPPYGVANPDKNYNMNIPPQQQQSPYYFNPNTNNMNGQRNANPNPNGQVPDSPGLPLAPGQTGLATAAPGVTTQSTTTSRPVGKPSEIITAKPQISQKDLSAKAKSLETAREEQLIQSLLSKTAAIPKHSEIVGEAPESVPGAGAVLAFIIGFGMSVIMVIMVGCRLRRVKLGSKRRGKNRLDPDYLVDGMYL